MVMQKQPFFFALFLLAAVLPPSSQVQARRLGEGDNEQQLHRGLQFGEPCKMGCPDPIKYPDYAPCGCEPDKFPNSMNTINMHVCGDKAQDDDCYPMTPEEDRHWICEAYEQNEELCDPFFSVLQAKDCTCQSRVPADYKDLSSDSDRYQGAIIGHFVSQVFHEKIPFAGNLVSALDVNRDGGVSMAEFDGFFDHLDAFPSKFTSLQQKLTMAFKCLTGDLHCMSKLYSPVFTVEDFNTPDYSVTQCLTHAPMDYNLTSTMCRFLYDSNELLLEQPDGSIGSFMETYIDGTLPTISKETDEFGSQEEQMEDLKFVQKWWDTTHWMGLRYERAQESFVWSNGEVFDNENNPKSIDNWDDEGQIPNGEGHFTPGKVDYCVAAWETEGMQWLNTHCDAPSLGTDTVKGFSCSMYGRDEPKVTGRHAGTVSVTVEMEQLDIGEIEWQIKFHVSGDDNEGLAMLFLDLEEDPSNPMLGILKPGSTLWNEQVSNFFAPLGYSNLDGNAYGNGIQESDSKLVDIGGAQNILPEVSSRPEWGQSSDINVVIDVGKTCGAWTRDCVLARGSLSTPSGLDRGIYKLNLSNVRAAVLTGKDGNGGYLIGSAASVTATGGEVEALMTQQPTTAPTPSPTRQPTPAPTPQPTQSFIGTIQNFANEVWDNGYTDFDRFWGRGVSGRFMCGAKSYHDNGREDRRWVFKWCASPYGGLYDTTATGFVNNWEAQFTYQCPTNKAVSFIESYHDNFREDRRFKFKCSAVQKTRMQNCFWTNYMNNWDSWLNVDFANSNSSPDRAIVGVSSYFDTNRNDRRFRFKVCQLYKYAA